MNGLPRIDEKVFKVIDAAQELSEKRELLMSTLDLKDFTINDELLAYNQILMNILTNEGKIYSKFQIEIEMCLLGLIERHSITIGDVLTILNDSMSVCVKKITEAIDRMK